MAADVGLLVLSFDGYADIWPLCADLFNRFWPDRQWPMYWMSNGEGVPSIAKPIVVPRMPRKQWGFAVEEAVVRMPTEFVAIWHEEILPLSTIPNDLFMEGAEHLAANEDVGIVQLTRYYYRDESNPTIGNFKDFPRTTAGYSSAMPAIFRKNVLLHLLKRLRRSNHFEQQSARVLEKDLPHVRSITSCKPMFKLCDNALLSGPWRRCAVKHLTELGIQVNYSVRGICPDECSYMEGINA